MSNRYRMTASQAELRLKFGIVVIREQDRSPPADVTPQRPAYVVRNYGGLILDVMPWGFQPATRNRSVVHEGDPLMPEWQEAIARPDRRCLVPATSFSEIETTADADGKRRRRWIRLPARPIFAFAGVWSDFLEGPGFAILRTTPNAVLAPIQPRTMPIILHEQDYDRWLTAPPEDVMRLAQPYPSHLVSID